ncbi:hypothetical protein AUJ95_08460 [Candidatus Desantisbacteria bacterium CG2_30_40_21]|uniref:Uncharacterized protein n=1 Tax=Candidatus Desantisbacteria bacterium CG2_30_40_21 TaxID=1817895 RepID=A0A1J5DM45_9BACT|nr:MAG: hypothetical protein AUJ95_08460 [Candidatus Desantisbacteria bacterium CG2_30_40_21]
MILGQYQKALELLNQGLKIAREIGDEQGEGVCLGNLGTTYQNLGQFDKAIGYSQQALVIDERFFGKKHPAVARDLNNLGSAWHTLGDLRQAKEYFRRAYLMFRDFFGDQHPHTKIAKGWLDRC